MFNFKKGKNREDEQVANAEEYLSSKENPEEEELETELSIPEEWDFPNEERYVFAFHNTENPKLKKNQISLYGIELVQNPNSISVRALVRSTVQQPIQFKETTILLLDGDKQAVARKEFDLTRLGNMPPNSARPFTFTFTEQDYLRAVEGPINDWSIAFELKSEHRLDLEESWEKSIAEEAKDSLEKIVKNAPSLKPGEVNFMGLEAKKKESGELVVTILIRNGADKNINLEQLPIGVKDASGNEIARGSFKLDNFTVKANTSKPWSFIFPATMVTQEEIDLSKWAAYVIQ